MQLLSLHPMSPSPFDASHGTYTPQADATSGEDVSPPTSTGPIHRLQDHYDVPITLPRFSPDELIGLSYLHELPDGQKVRAKIVKKTHDMDAANHQRIKMLVAYDDDT